MDPNVDIAKEVESAKDQLIDQIVDDQNNKLSENEANLHRDNIDLLPIDNVNIAFEESLPFGGETLIEETICEDSNLVSSTNEQILLIECNSNHPSKDEISHNEACDILPSLDDIPLPSSTEIDDSKESDDEDEKSVEKIDGFHEDRILTYEEHVDAQYDQGSPQKMSPNTSNLKTSSGLDNIDNELDFEDDKEEERSRDEEERLQEDEERSDSIKSLNSEGAVSSDEEPKVNQEEGEASEGEDLEEGEVKEGAASAAAATASQASTTSPPKPPTCKFYVRGYCQYGANCRFLHPGFSKDNKGKYSMFEPPKFPMAPRPPPRPHFFGPIFRHPFPPGPMPPFPNRIPLRPGFIPPPRIPIPPVAEHSAPKESAWERGLRHAKERIKEASRRKEEEPDFEEKRLNLTFDGSESTNAEEDKEDSYPKRSYAKDSEDSLHEENEFFNDEKYRYESHSRRHPHSRRHHSRRKKAKPISFKEFLERERAYKKYRKFRKKQKEIKWKKQVYGEYNPSKAKADEWRDPWRRSKSPHSRRSFSREGSRSSFSSGSYSDERYSRSPSYSGSSSSGSFSYSSGSGSYSRSRSPSYPPYGAPSPPASRSRGGRYGGPYAGITRGSRKRMASSPELTQRAKKIKKSPGKNIKKDLSPNIKISIKNFSPKKEASSSPITMPKSQSRSHSISRSASRSASRSSGSRSRSRSRSRSYSRSLSATPSKSSASSNASSRSPSPISHSIGGVVKKSMPPPPSTTPPLPPNPPLPKVSDEKQSSLEPVVRFVSSAKDKQHIKLTLLSKKNALEPSPLDDPDLDQNSVDSEPRKKATPPPPAPAPAPPKTNNSRREELLKQLKAVEDAIARKRVKP